MPKPRPVRSGDRIAIVAPASNCSRDEFDRGVAELRRLGFEPVFEPSVFERRMFTAGCAQTRAAAFLQAWADPSVAALVAVRGGYGSVELLPFLQQMLPQPPKLFVGYSDNTSLLTWLTLHRGIPALHGPMLDGRLARGPTAYDEPSFCTLLAGGHPVSLEPEGVRVIRDGEAAGLLTGGTMTQLTASLGTPYAFTPPPGALLFLEDVNERPYRVHRMLTQLKLAGVLSPAAGLVFGEMRGCDEPDGKVTVFDVIEEFAVDFAGPVVTGFPSGHTSGPCWTVPFGVRCRVVARSRPALIVEESPVE